MKNLSTRPASRRAPAFPHATLRCSVFLALCFASVSSRAQEEEPNLIAHWTCGEEDGAAILDQSGNNNGAEIVAVWNVGRMDEPMPGLWFDGGAISLPLENCA